MERTCDCGGELEFKETEWAKFNFSDDEEIVAIYVCKECKREYTKRNREEWY